jgi:hypothetical protein
MYLCFKQGFDIKKYGLLGKPLNEGEKHLNTVGIEEKQVEIESNPRNTGGSNQLRLLKRVEKIVYTSDDISS